MSQETRTNKTLAELSPRISPVERGKRDYTGEQNMVEIKFGE